MKQISVIQLSDTSIHQSKQIAERHLTNLICSGVNIEMIDKLANINKSLNIRDYIFKNRKLLKNLINLMDELKEVQDL